MKKIRNNVFETNSSSSHSITIADSNNLLDTLNVVDGTVTIYNDGEFGWEYEKYNDAYHKAKYCAVFAEFDDLCKDTLIRVVKKQTGCENVKIINNDGYIDHQSYDLKEDIFETDESLRNFIFNPHSTLVIDNDNN